MLYPWPARGNHLYDLPKIIGPENGNKAGWSCLCVQSRVAVVVLAFVGCSQFESGVTHEPLLTKHRRTGASWACCCAWCGKGATPGNSHRAMPKKLLTLRNKSVQGQLQVYADVLIQTTSGALAQLAGLGVQVRTVTVQRHRHASVAVDTLDAIDALPGVNRSKLRSESGCTTISQRAGLKGGYSRGMNNPRGAADGAGVIVGIIDSGIDWTHGDFIDDSTGESRILSYWDQTDATDNNPPTSTDPNLTYGYEYTKADIDGALSGFDHSSIEPGQRAPSMSAFGVLVAIGQVRVRARRRVVVGRVGLIPVAQDARRAGRVVDEVAVGPLSMMPTITPAPSAVPRGLFIPRV